MGDTIDSDSIKVSLEALTVYITELPITLFSIGVPTSKCATNKPS